MVQLGEYRNDKHKLIVTVSGSEPSIVGSIRVWRLPGKLRDMGLLVSVTSPVRELTIAHGRSGHSIRNRWLPLIYLHDDSAKGLVWAEICIEHKSIISPHVTELELTNRCGVDVLYLDNRLWKVDRRHQLLSIPEVEQKV